MYEASKESACQQMIGSETQSSISIEKEEVKGKP